MWKILFVFVLFPTAVFADDPILEVGVSLSKNEIVQLEPVVLKVSLSTVSPHKQPVTRIFDDPDDLLQVRVIGADGKAQKVPLPRDITPVIPAFMRMSTEPKGSVIHHRIVLASLPRGWMDQPGEYTLSVTFNTGEAEFRSNVVTLTIKEAEGVDAKALERFRGFPQMMYFAGVTTDSVIGMEFEAVIEDHRESVYVPWCYYALGRAAQRHKDIPEKQRAMWARSNYGALLEKFPKFPLKAELQYEMARELIRLEKPDEAVRELQKLSKIGDKNPNAELFIFRQARWVLGLAGDGNRQVQFEKLPDH